MVLISILQYMWFFEDYALFCHIYWALQVISVMENKLNNFIQFTTNRDRLEEINENHEIFWAFPAAMNIIGNMAFFVDKKSIFLQNIQWIGYISNNTSLWRIQKCYLETNQAVTINIIYLFMFVVQ